MNFYPNPSAIISQETFLASNCIQRLAKNPLSEAISLQRPTRPLQSKVKQHSTPYQRRSLSVFYRGWMDARSPEAFFEFAKCNPAHAENSGLQ
jgi:hypothetical protein